LLQLRLGSSRAAQIVEPLFRVGGGGTPPPSATNLVEFYMRSGMTSTELGQIINDIKFSEGYTRGRVNINTASAAVLNALFLGIGVDQSTAASASQQLVNYRQQNPTLLTSIAWLVDTLQSSSPAIVTALRRGDYITTRSFQFTADVAATGPYGRGYRRVKFIFDVSDGTPKILYRQDLSRLGWALGKQTRDTWLAQNTK
jgi:hypothetical protein